MFRVICFRFVTVQGGNLNTATPDAAFRDLTPLARSLSP